MASLTLAMPGNSGTLLWLPCCNSCAVEPGLTIKSAPASTQASYCLGVSTVPAPIIASGKAVLSCLMAFKPYSLRRVISNTVSPPLTNAVQTPRACSAFSRVSTGTTGALAHITSMRALLACMR